MIRCIWVVSMVLFVFGAPCRAADSVKETGKEIGQGFKKIGTDTGKAFKEGGKEVGQGFKNIGTETGKAFKEGGKETGTAAKKSGRTMGDWFRDAGHSFKKIFTGS
jgi:hypothetical protein